MHWHTGVLKLLALVTNYSFFSAAVESLRVRALINELGFGNQTHAPLQPKAMSQRTSVLTRAKTHERALLVSRIKDIIPMKVSTRDNRTDTSRSTSNAMSSNFSGQGFVWLICRLCWFFETFGPLVQFEASSESVEFLVFDYSPVGFCALPCATPLRSIRQCSVNRRVRCLSTFSSCW